MFRKKRRRVRDSVLTERAAAGIIRAIEKVQQRWAYTMTRISAHFSNRGQRYILLLFVTGSSLLSVTVIIDAILYPAKPGINIHRLPVPLLLPEISDTVIGHSNK